MTEWREPRVLRTNASLLDWLKEAAEPPRRGGFELAGYELHAHPDLVERLVECVAGLPLELVAAFGVPCVQTQDGRIVAFARGTNQICIRGLEADTTARPAGSPDPWGGVDAFFPEKWHGTPLDQRRTRQAADQRELLEHIRALIKQAAAAPEVVTREPLVGHD